MTPYIGVTGFVSRSEVQSIFNTIPENSSRLLMVGVLARYKTLKGIQNKWPNRYPKVEDIDSIFFRHDKILNLIHYSTKETESLADQLTEITQFCSPYLNGFQLNMAWPSPKAISQYCALYNWDKKIVLQIGSKALKAVNNSPKILASRVAEYKYIADYALIDPSGGLGIPFNTDRARDYLEALSVKKLHMGFGVAGGLSPTTLDLVEPLIKDFPSLNIDAEGKLRDQKDHLDIDLTTKYIRKAFKLFR